MSFIVLDLRLTKVGVQRNSFFYALTRRAVFFPESGFFRKPRVENRVMFPLFLCFPLAKRMFPPCEPYVLRCGTVCFS